MEKTALYPAGQDEELLRRAKELDPDAFGSLLGRYMPLIQYKAARFQPVGLERDDLVQEGLMGLLQAVRGYDASRGASFATFANTCITNRILSAVKSGLKPNPMIDFVSIQELDDLWHPPKAGDSATQPEEAVIRQENMQAKQALLRAVLSPRESKILALYLGGHIYQEIAHILQTSAKVVDNALQRVRRKLRAVEV